MQSDKAPLLPLLSQARSLLGRPPQRVTDLGTGNSSSCSSSSPPSQHTNAAYDTPPQSYCLKCTDGIFRGKFLYPSFDCGGELFGSDVSNENLTMLIENANLAPLHARIDLDAGPGAGGGMYLKAEEGETWTAVRWNRSLPLQPGQVVEFNGSSGTSGGSSSASGTTIRLKVEEGEAIEDEILEWLKLYGSESARDAVSESCHTLEDLRDKTAEEVMAGDVSKITEGIRTGLAELGKQFPFGVPYPRKRLVVRDESSNQEYASVSWSGGHIVLGVGSGAASVAPAGSFQTGGSAGSTSLLSTASSQSKLDLSQIGSLSPSQRRIGSQSLMAAAIQQFKRIESAGLDDEQNNFRICYCSNGKFYCHFQCEIAERPKPKPTAAAPQNPAQNSDGSQHRHWLKLLPEQRHLLQPGDAFRIGALEFSVLRYNFGRASDRGFRNAMEDSDLVEQDLAVSAHRLCSMFAIYDGHCKRECVDFVRSRLHLEIAYGLQGGGLQEGKVDEVEDEDSTPPRGEPVSPVRSASPRVVESSSGCGIVDFVRSRLHLEIAYGLQGGGLQEGKVDEVEDVHQLVHDVIASACKTVDDAFEVSIRNPHAVTNPHELYSTSLDTSSAPVVNVAPHTSSSGCAAVFCLLLGSSLYTACVGDSRAVLSRNRVAYDLSWDHRPDREDEKKRILDSGGFVSFSRVLGRLAVSRAFGDFEYKSLEHTKGPLVIAEPETRYTEVNNGGLDNDHSGSSTSSSSSRQKLGILDNDDEFLILACDGLWDVMKSQEAVDFVWKMRVTGQRPVEHLTPAQRQEQQQQQEVVATATVTEDTTDPEEIAKALVHEAIHVRKSRDNVSCVVVFLQNAIRSPPATSAAQRGPAAGVPAVVRLADLEAPGGGPAAVRGGGDQEEIRSGGLGGLPEGVEAVD
eukprot:g8127.t1